MYLVVIVTSPNLDAPIPMRRERTRSGAAASTVEDALLRTLFAEAPDGIVVVDREGRLLTVNDRFCELVGRSRSELLSSSVTELVVPADADRLTDARRCLFACAGGLMESGRWRIRRSHGGALAVEVRARILSSGHYLAFVREASELPVVRVEEDVTRMHETEAALRRAVQSRDEVLRVVSHDLRDPLQCIALTAQQLGEAGEAGPETPALRKAVDRIMRASHSMARLIDDLLDVASIEAGRLGLRPAALRADALLRESLDAHQAQAGSRGVALSLAAAAPVTIVGDQGRLMQVLSNIVGNALKLTPTGGAITLSASEDGDVVRFTVADTGPGIPSEHVDRVFEPFWQGGLPDRRGRGLGLTIARGIVEAHGGRIWLDSELGRGTAVSFTIPRAARPALT